MSISGAMPSDLFGAALKMFGGGAALPGMGGSSGSLLGPTTSGTSSGPRQVSPGDTSSKATQSPTGGGKSGNPTVKQLMSASTAAYTGTTPDGMRPFTVDGKPVTYSDSNGVVAKAYVTSQNKIVITYQGTTSPSQVGADIALASGTPSPGEKASAQFASSVVSMAAKQGYSSKDVFVTGHSLGGAEAEFAASQTGLGGAAFDGPGIVKSGGKGNGSNFLSVGNGDIVSAISGGPLQHYGKNVTVGGGSQFGLLSSILNHIPFKEQQDIDQSSIANERV